MLGFADRLVAALAGLLLVALLAVIMAGVVSRALDDPFIWTDEVARFLMVWLAALGWMLATRRHAHIRIRYFLGLVPERARAIVEVLLQASVAMFGAAVVWHAWRLVLKNTDIEATTVPIAMSVMYAPIVLAGLWTMAQACVDLIGAARGEAP